ncbi:CASP-like protein 5A1 [Canna indica]|uniref:CASP-like protein 5A1 n=1 Tax=Canna indica TaxID=4628 RepID=A0AAQ3KZU1_9LILI|nr:CASP-like protein 5A1 [Canna indica]
MRGGASLGDAGDPTRPKKSSDPSNGNSAMSRRSERGDQRSVMLVGLCEEGQNLLSYRRSEVDDRVPAYSRRQEAVHPVIFHKKSNQNLGIQNLIQLGDRKMPSPTRSEVESSATFHLKSGSNLGNQSQVIGSIDSNLSCMEILNPVQSCKNPILSDEYCGDYVAMYNPLFISNASSVENNKLVGNKEGEEAREVGNKEGRRRNMGVNLVQISENHLTSKQPGSWAALFREAHLFEGLVERKESSEKLTKIQKVSNTYVVIEENLIVSARNEWSNSLYGKFYERTPSLGVVQQPLIERIETIPIWVHLPGLLIEFMKKEVLVIIANSIGKLVKIDEVTLMGQRAKFARLCVLWELNKKVPSGIWINIGGKRFWQAVAFENIIRFYFNCGKIGHVADNCIFGKDIRSEVEKKGNANDNMNSDMVEERKACNEEYENKGNKAQAGKSVSGKVGKESVKAESARLDRVFCNANWLEWNYSIDVVHMQRIGSDHRPLLVDLNECYVCKQREDDYVHFLFECKYAKKYWLKVQDNLEISFKLQDAWKEDKWLEEGAGYDKESGKKLIAMIANSMWLLWKIKNSSWMNDKEAGVGYIMFGRHSGKFIGNARVKVGDVLAAEFYVIWLDADDLGVIGVHKMFASRPAVHPVEAPPLTDATENPPRLRMKDVQGMPGTPGGLALRLAQFVFAAAALGVMVSTGDFTSVTAFW